jgi:hypothetical protein
MGFTDKLKDLKTQAEGAVSEHSDQIHQAVEKAAATADKSTGGKYTEKIQQAGSKADSLVAGVGSGPQEGEPAEAEVETEQ